MKNRLESLELQGLKTFAIKTQLEFPGKITAIVGPNGSGKSNIADAIRWVLGEQSFSLLRAKRTDDMIFSGSQQRSRAGMASTTITFNNEDGWLPIDYSHVAITRQAYRDGQNEYILNGQKVRLKDVSELLSQTGLSERNYTIIGQGLVDTALALKPDERRKLFEEAAGIGLYRSRKEEAQRRLESTRKNMDRVLDILTEIKPRLRSLERQAQRFQEYQQIQADLHLVLREWYGFQWHQKQQDLRQTHNAYQEQGARMRSSRKKHLEAETKVEEARAQLQSYRKELEAYHRELAENHSHLEQTTRELAIIEERQRSYELQKDNLELDISNLEEEIKGMDAQGLTLTTEIEQRQKDFNSGAEDVKISTQKLVDIRKTKEHIDIELDDLKTKRIQLETEKIQGLVRIEELNNQELTLLDERGKIQNAISMMQTETEEVKQQCLSAEAILKKTFQNFEKQQKQIDLLSENLDELEHEHTKIKQEINDKDNQREKLTTQLTLLKDAEKALSGYSEGSKKLLEISRQGRLLQGIEPISQYIVVEEQYERAISAALGELTDLLVMPPQGRAKLINYLESKENDRVALVSIDQTGQGHHQQNFNEMDGVIGFANTLVSAEVPYKNLIDILLSDILIVKDADAAERLTNNLKTPIIVVTLSGIVFHPKGIIISGQSPTGKRIGRTRQHSELQTELLRVQKEIETLSKEQTRASNSIAQLLAEQQELKQVLTLYEQEKLSNERALQDVNDTLARLTEQQCWHNDRLKTLDTTINEIQSSIQSGQGKLVDLDGQINVALEEEQNINLKLKAIPLFETQQTLNQLETHQLIAQNALESVQQRFQDNSDRLEMAKQRLLGLK
ncbi:MAG: AAA family ATPase [Chloroflexi bacterium]|nr:AAA family ATPase [Chloroflexota bacterium]